MFLCVSYVVEGFTDMRRYGGAYGAQDKTRSRL